ncbi:MAG: hypothetical protein KDC24_08550, partial [Saprospiraceae bacterium]|nr:hypothetical protein [Saprospiraceae bacterium]
MKITCVLLFLLPFLCFPDVVEAQVLNDYIPFYRTGTSYLSDSAPSTVSKSVKKDENGNYFFLMQDDCDDTYLGGFFPECIEWEQEVQEWRSLYLVKVTPDLKVDTFANLKGVSSFYTDLTVCQNRVFVSYSNHGRFKDSLLIVGDTLLILNEGGVLEFDEQLNFKRVFIDLDKEIENIACKDSVLYVQSNLRDNRNRIEHFTVIYGDTLWNFFDRDGIPADKAPFILSYNLNKDSIETYWIFGSDGDSYIYDMATDQTGNLIITFDAGWAEWFCFNGVDTIRTGQYYGDYFLKYKPNGDLVFAKEQPFTFSRIRVVEDGFFVQIRVPSDFGWINLYGDTIFGCFEPTLPAGILTILIKYDSNGDFMWYYLMGGCSQAAELEGFDEKSGIVSCTYDISGADFELQGQQYTNTGKSIALVNLDGQSGKVIGHLVKETDHAHFTGGFFEIVEKDRYRSLFFLNKVDNFFGMPLGDISKGITYFADFNLDLFTKTNDKVQDEISLSVYPSPTNSTLHFQYPIDLYAPLQIQL